MRKLFPLFLSILLLITLVPVVGAQDDASFMLTILHTNDTHAQHLPNSDGDGGVARQMTVVNQIRDSADNVLLLDSGDRFTGTLFHQQYHGQDNVQIMNMLGYDAMGLGNHEFDNGDDLLAMFVEGLDFPVVNSNIDFSASDALADMIAPYVVLDVGGEQVGVVGVLTADTVELASPGDELAFNSDIAAATQSAVDELTAMDVNKIIALTHIGYQHDLDLAADVTGLDVVIGGHDNALLSNMYADAEGPYPTVVEAEDGAPVLVVQAHTKTEYLGHLNVEFDAEGHAVDWEGDAILLSRYITPDPAMTTLVTSLEEPIAELKVTPVGEAAVPLVGDRAVCRVEECNLGNLITDALRMQTGADIALQNGGGIRADIAQGEVTLGDVLTVLPFGNLTSTLELEGADVVAALENGVSQVEEVAGRFPQVSGLRYTWDGSQPAGSRIVSVEVLNSETGEYEPLDPAAVYSVATNDYMRTGGDGYSVLAENAIDPYDYGTPLDEIVATYITENNPVAPEVEGRITRVDQ